MKSAKEWAGSVVIGADRDADRRLSRLQDPEDEELGAWLQRQDSWYAESLAAGDARRIIERLVERAQADARAPLVELISELADELRARVYYADDGADVEPLLAKAEEALR